LAAAQAIGFPPNVVACAPIGHWSINSFEAIVTPSGIPAAIPLTTAIISGVTSKVCAANQLPVRPDPGCTSSKINNIPRSEEHTSELQSRFALVCRILLGEKHTAWKSW